MSACSKNDNKYIPREQHEEILKLTEKNTHMRDSLTGIIQRLRGDSTELSELKKDSVDYCKSVMNDFYKNKKKTVKTAKKTKKKEAPSIEMGFKLDNIWCDKTPQEVLATKSNATYKLTVSAYCSKNTNLQKFEVMSDCNPDSAIYTHIFKPGLYKTSFEINQLFPFGTADIMGRLADSEGREIKYSLLKNASTEKTINQKIHNIKESKDMLKEKMQELKTVFNSRERKMQELLKTATEAAQKAEELKNLASEK